MIHLIVLTKTNNFHDFEEWYTYHTTAFHPHIIILDNESPIDIRGIVSPNDTYIRVEGWANQYTRYNDIINSSLFADGDYIITIDDDEYLYWNHNTTLEEFLDTCPCPILAIPQILISTHSILESRTTLPLPMSHVYRRNDYATTCKSIVRFNRKHTYDYTAPDRVGVTGHIPSIDQSEISACTPHISHTTDPTFDIFSNSAFAVVDYQSALRLYHYHIKSKLDWDIKVLRGSAATISPWYDRDITRNIWYNEYDILDYDMSKKFISVKSAQHTADRV